MIPASFPHRIRRSIGSPARFASLSVAFLALAGTAPLRAAPENLGLGLKELAEAFEPTAAKPRVQLAQGELQTRAAQFHLAQLDKANRVLVDVFLNGALSVASMEKVFALKGLTVTGSVDWYRKGVISAWVPITELSSLATTPGVSSVELSPKPHFNVGSVTSQGVQALHANQVNTTYPGTGITVGVLSDSYNTSTTASKTAAQDVASGDLPGTGNPGGYTTPVKVVAEDPGAGTDEGRAMLQIVHDVAPGSPLAFATGEGGLAAFANNITALANAGCKVICDDLSVGNETMFSDGLIAQAVDHVSNNNGVAYFSSAGNDGNSGYLGTFSPQANNAANQALLSSEGGIAYGSIPTSETSVISQFHSFGTNASGNPVLVQKVLIPTANNATGSINFQWDDPSDVLTNNQASVTTDFDILVFSVSGTTATYQAALSGTANNFATNEPIELPATALTAGTQYEFVIVKTTRMPTNAAITANQATHLRWALRTDQQQVIGDYVTPSSPNSFGHDCAQTCNGTAAYQYDATFNTTASTYSPIIEAFSSNGNVNIYFDSAGNRLASAETRKQPVLSAIDGVDTTFFGTDVDGDGYPNFFGTSAAAPHAAGCAAILLNAASVLGKPLAPADVRALLVNNTQGISDQDPGIAKATATLAGVSAATTSVAFTAIDHSLFADPYSLNVAFTGVSGQQLTALTITLPSGQAFYPDAYAITPGASTGATPPSISSSTSSDFSSTATLNFSSFDPGDTLSFGVGRFLQVGTTGTYRSTTKTDVLGGATISCTVTGPNAGTYTGTLANTTSHKWNYKSGYGLIDINAAVTALQNGQ